MPKPTVSYIPRTPPHPTTLEPGSIWEVSLSKNDDRYVVLIAHNHLAPPAHTRTCVVLLPYDRLGDIVPYAEIERTYRPITRMTLE